MNDEILKLAQKFEKLSKFTSDDDIEDDEAPKTQRSPAFSIQSSPRELIILTQILVNDMVRAFDKKNYAVLAYQSKELKWRAEELEEMLGAKAR